MAFSSGPNSALGMPLANASYVDSTERVPVGTIIDMVDATQGPGRFIYLPGLANVAAGGAVIYDLTPGARVVALTDSDLHANTGYPVAVAVVAVPAGSFGWYQIGGVAKTKAIAGGAAGRCFLTADNTTGAFDDTAIAGCQVLGARQLTAVDTPAVGFSYTLLSNPHIQGQDAT